MYLSQEDGTDSLVTNVQEKAPNTTDCTSFPLVCKGLYTKGFPILFYFYILFISFHIITPLTLDILMSANKCFSSVLCRDFVTEY